MNFYYGVVENRQDPLELGRCQVRIVGLHTHDKSLLPTADLPWSTPLQSVNSAAMNGIGFAPVGPVEGTAVVVIFADDDYQQGVILGTVGGVSTAPGTIDEDNDVDPLIPEDIAKIELVTIEGPVTGTKLTFVDKKYGKTNLTSKLTPNMKVNGFGIKEETVIVSVDSGTEITISNAVENYGENIITFKPAPTNLEAVRQSKAQGTLTDGSGNPVVDGSGTPIKTTTPESATTAAPVTPSAVNDSIPTIPPPKSVPNVTKATEGIKALLAACDKVGLKTKEQKCALLGIAGGESAWVPKLEYYNYSPARLKEVFSFATPEDVEKYSNAQKKGMSREEFFSWVYGPTKRGKNFLGNKTDADGGKYLGRGFIGLTGRENYTLFEKEAKKLGINLDLVNDPDSLDKDINVSAIVAALYFKIKVPASVNPSAHPGYFEAAKKAVGYNVPNIAAAKRSYYEYFYGNGSYGGVDKDAAPPAAEPPKDNTAFTTPGPSADSVRTGSNNTGFRDPNNKYPLKSYLNEPDTNRLARGVIEGTIVEKKDSSVVTGVPKALDQGKWDQPKACYGAQYPYNKVFETESGHVQEFDDTPGQERIHTYHRSGTFSEIDPQGTQVNYIVGDNFVIMERNGCIKVAGECNITVDGNTNIFARSDANIEVTGNADIQVKNNLNIGVATDTTMSVGGDFKLKVVGDFSLDAANVQMRSADQFDLLVGTAARLTSNGSMELLSSGNMRLDYSRGDFGNGANSAQFTDTGLTPPTLQSPSYPSVPFLIPPERRFEEKAIVETEEDANTPEGRARIHKQQQTDGVAGATPPAPDETAKPTGGTETVVPTDCKIIYTTKNFTNDYRISKNFTLGMLIDGGVGGRHKLVDQMLTDFSGSTRLYTVQEIVCNLAQTSQNILEPLLEVLPGNIGGYKKQWNINSGYRLKGVLKVESPTSDHCKGLALDIGIIDPNKIQKTYDLCVAAEKLVPYNQIILEYAHPTSVWMHISYKSEARMKWAFTMLNYKTYQRNAQGIPSGFVLLPTISPPSK
jgi:predicted chitinase